MDYFSTRTADKSAPYVDEIVVNTTDDLRKIPVENYSPGTTCIVITTVQVFMLDLNKQWKEL